MAGMSIEAVAVPVGASTIKNPVIAFPDERLVTGSLISK
jgi:hypothetical protein